MDVYVSSAVIFLWASLWISCGLTQGQGVTDPCYFWPGAAYAGDGLCFFHNNTVQDYNSSKFACDAEGGTLAEIRTDQQRYTARTLINSLGSAWLGARNSLLDGNVTWVSDGEQVSSPQGWWLNPYLFQNVSSEVCLVITSASVFDLIKCADAAGYLCQIYAGNPCDSYLPGADYYDNNCYWPVDEETTFDDAKDQCERLEGFLVEPRTNQQFIYLKMILSLNLDPTKPAWLGMVPERNSPYLDFLWVSSNAAVTTPYWAQGEVPVRTLTSDDAVVMDGTKAWAWRVVSRSSVRAQVVCQRDISRECSGLFFLGRCFILYSELKTWSEAREDCISKDTYLAEPKTELLSRAVDKYLMGYTNIRAVHLGGHDLTIEGQFMWDHSGENFTYTNWSPGEPNDILGVEHYLQWFYHNQKWDDIKEFYRTAYLCERLVKPFFHSYVVVVPQAEYGSGVRHTKVWLSLSSQPGFEEENPVKITTVPTRQIITRTLVGSEAFQYEVDEERLYLESSGIQDKYILIQSLLPLDVLYFYHGFINYGCVSLVYESLPYGRSSSFFSLPRLGENSIGIISTDKAASNLKLSFTTFHQTLSFVFNSTDVITRNTLMLSASIPEQYQSLYVDSLTGASTSQLIHSTGPLAVFDFGKEARSASLDVSCDQVLPTSMVGSDYVTFPSLPLDPGVIDYFTVVAVYGATEIAVYSNENATAIKEITLWWSGDTTHLELPATGFHYVNGTGPFYLYAKMTGEDPNHNGRGGRCSVTLLHEGLFRESYKLPVFGLLTSATVSLFVVVVVRSADVGATYMGTETGFRMGPDFCETVSDTDWSGCYFHVTTISPGLVYRVQMAPYVSSPFGAYVFARTSSRKKLFCFQLGLPYLLTDDLSQEFDYPDYEARIKSKPVCSSQPSSTPKPQKCPVPENKTTVTLTPAELQDAIEKITTHLTVEKSSLSSTKRAKESAPDKRASSSSMGYFSLFFIFSFLGLVIVSDFGKIFFDLKIAVANLRQAKS